MLNAAILIGSEQSKMAERSKLRRLQIMLAILVFTVPVMIADGKARAKIACKTLDNTASCHWIHGRLAAYNGTPALRLWEVRTHHLLGIYSGPSINRRSLDNEDPELPASVAEKLKPFENQIFADFEVCPLEPQKVGWMQAACIESAKKIVVDQ